ncbi:SRPBCC domain-containing protein [Phyllobacterium salinisoli]|uniref:SRPBCC domain-containing protein n=1 Tax=Phyllobacterium salinisoli TaxID=1899321 RepID=A0A368K0B7_9HYPH|nr:SRPBCC domain-containing protein [Phyllobacterium salinisoli]RCS22829.1 SRPBCC domain-containing protein [Phyllobacterium salinisoli]
MNDAATAGQSDAELIISRLFDAPRALVFEAWTNPDHLNRWCCPIGFTLPFSQGDIRSGGWFKTCMRSPEGEDHWLSGTYREVKPHERIVFTHAWHDETGKPGQETVVTITLRDENGRTQLTLHQALFDSKASRDGHQDGWNATLDSLETYLPEMAG